MREFFTREAIICCTMNVWDFFGVFPPTIHVPCSQAIVEPASSLRVDVARVIPS